MVDCEKSKELLKKVIWEQYDKPGAVVKAQKIAYPLLPERLFKFRGITDGALNNFMNDTLFCAKPNTFNDPFDCGLTFKGPDVRKLMSQALIKLGLDTPARLELIRTASDVYAACADIAEEISQGAAVVAKATFARQLEDLLFEPVKTLADKMKDSVTICSLTERIDSLPMWAHYGDDHKGFAMEYNFHKLDSRSKLRGSIWPVLYDEKLYDVTSQIFGRPVKKFNDLLALGAALGKSIDWKYEREWRIVKRVGLGKSGGNVQVPSPVAIYVGAEAQSDKIKDLLTIAARKEIPVFRMALAKHEFKMIPKPI